MLKKILSGLSSGILISIGGAVFLSCGADGNTYGKYIGAVLFTVALLCICIKGYTLYTGKIGFIVEEHGKEYFSSLLLGLFGNAAGTVACGYVLRYAISDIGTYAEKICNSKLDQSFPQTLIRGIFCGILMYLAVSIYKEKKNVIGIIFCIPVFILAGFEHSIADIFYFASSGIVSWRAFGFLWTVILGNTVGAVILPLINYARKSKNAEKS